MTAVLHCLDALRALVADEAVREQDGKLVASPNTTEEVTAIARYANEHELTVEIAGAGTKRGWGNSVDAEIVLEMSRLAGVREHSWQDLTATVGAGTTWAAMQRVLAVHGQHVALDPLWPETATVGGIVATNDSGALRLKYGSLRDLIIGMTIVLADGTIARSGGKVVKNVAGYDLHKLMIGAYGTLGVIAEVTFRLHPIAAQAKTWTIASQDAKSLGELMMKVLDCQLSVQAMQMRADGDGYALDVELATLQEVITVQMESLERTAQSVEPKAGCVFARVERTNCFAAREELFATDGGVIIKATMLPSRIANVSQDVVRLGGAAVTQATGIMFARFSEEAAVGGIPALHEGIAGDGSLTILRMPLQFAALRRTEEAPTLMREIKRRFDPKRALNPGRFIGGI